MTEPFRPPENQPVEPFTLPYAKPDLARLNRRPKSVTVLARIGILLCALSVLGLALRLIGTMVIKTPVTTAIRADPVLSWWKSCSVAVNLILLLTLFVGAVAALSQRPFGRATLIVYAWLNVGITMAGQIVDQAILRPRLNQIYHNALLHSQIRTIPHLSALLSPVFAIASLVYPLMILYFFNTTPVREAFQNARESRTIEGGSARRSESI